MAATPVLKCAVMREQQIQLLLRKSQVENWTLLLPAKKIFYRTFMILRRDSSLIWLGNLLVDKTFLWNIQDIGCVPCDIWFSERWPSHCLPECNAVLSNLANISQWHDQTFCDVLGSPAEMSPLFTFCKAHYLPLSTNHPPPQDHYPSWCTRCISSL